MKIFENLEKILNGELKVLYSISLRNNIIKFNSLGEYKCSNCSIKDWKNKPITLEIEHIDGDKWNNKRDNLELLCPNCHSQTKTYRGKNKKSKFLLDNIQEQKIIDNIKKGISIKNILIELNLSGEGKNYEKIYKILKKNNINYKKIRENFISLSKKKKLEIKSRNKNYNIWIENKKQEILNSNIDFSKIGWRKEVAKILDYSPQATKRWILTNLPQIKF